eukprot:TRINITY_DN1619_c0_g1_i3.p1 TRINITY_DN1619_c0_g1~~TRINITY_DN1619_c0_g1_i3.p1  ORF type:complete len:436 (-),score=66.46 TRINITY_DN1619_c0_g1_i3:96-1403(-)
MHHHRVQQEKNKLSHDIEKLKNLHKQFETKYQELSNKYEIAMKEKMLLKLERDRLVAKAEALQKTVQGMEEKLTKDASQLDIQKLGEGVGAKGTEQRNSQPSSPKAKKGKLTPFPPDERTNPFMHMTFESFNTKSVILSRTHKSHLMSIGCMAIHPKKSIVATASDDMCWKIFTISQNAELIMCGEGHRDWLSGIDFHPRGTHLATCSGDTTIKIWDFINASCAVTFRDHIQPVWSVSFHDTGDFLVSGSMDHSSKLFDIPAQKQRYTFRGHVDSVNHVVFQNFSNVFASASADKTLSLWDIKSGLCVQTFYGHMNAVNHVAFSLRGDVLTSCDADGVVKCWDIRMVKERYQFDCGPHSANSCHIDKSGTIVAVGSDDNLIRLFNLNSGKAENTLRGHEDAVQDVKFDYNSKMLLSCGSDGSWRIWQQQFQVFDI